MLDNFFAKKPPKQAGQENDSHREQADGFSSSLSSSGLHASDRKTLRLERRELLYAVVRESMSRIGILSSSYKFKVLSLDPRGRQYMIMMDLHKELVAEPNRLGEIEAVVAQNAKARHDIVVTAVYWRTNEPVIDATARKTHTSSSTETRQPVRRSEPAAAPLPTLNEPQSTESGRFEPIREDEVAAFKQALGSGAGSGASDAKAKRIKSWRHVPVPRVDFADTQIQDPEATKVTPTRRRELQDTEAGDGVEKASPLSSTQYGDLN